ncbi:MAG: fibronectin type III domain-containing protein, partial [Cryobacterium sp.]
MIARWIAAHRSLVATVTSGTVVAALIAAMAVVSGGYTAQRLDLGDAAVWVTNEARQVVGRANTAVRELNTVVAAGSSSLDLLQQGATVLVIDRGNSSLDILDPATATVAESVPLPPVNPSVYLAADRAVVASDGNIWNLAADELADFDSLSKPTLSLGAGSVTSMDANGVFFSFTPATGDLARVDTTVGDAVVSTVTLDAGAAEDHYQLTSVDGHWALLNATSGRVFLSGQQVDLAGDIATDGGPALQQPSVTGDRILIAHDQGLVAVSISGGHATVLVSGRNGDAAAPASAGDCSYAAWGDGGVWRSCAGQSSRGATAALEGVAGNASLGFRMNGSALLLNDARGGAAWAVQQGNELIDNWDD